MDLERLNALLVRATGQAVSMNMQARLGQSLDAQAAALGCSVEQYLERLEAPRTAEERAALQSLINLNTVGKTLLWRYPEQLALITEVLLPALDRHLPPSMPLNIWSAACSTGEEVYSVLLSLALQGALAPGRRPLHVVATDINTDSLALARSGLLNDLRSRSLPAACAPYVERVGAELYVHESLRSRVHFVQANLVDRRTYPPVSGGWHLVLCANVLFYFDRSRGLQVLEDVAQAMAPRSALLLGGAETLAQEATPFALARWRSSFAYVRGAWEGLDPLPAPSAPAPAPPPAPGLAAAATAAAAPSAPPAPLPLPPAAWEAALAGDRQACVEVCRTTDLAAAAVSADTCCMLGLVALQHGYGTEAAVALTAATDKDRFAFYPHYYLGLAYAQQQRPHDAIPALRRALFLQPRNALVRYAFAQQLLRAGDTARAREALGQLLEGLGAATLDRGPHGDRLSPEVVGFVGFATADEAEGLRRAVEGLLARSC